jgi:hypothetical protein
MKNLKQVCRERLKLSLESVERVLRCIAGAMVRDRAQPENVLLVQRLARLRGDYNQLQREMDELLRYADREIEQLKQTNTKLAREYDDLQLRVWELEQQVDELLLYIAQWLGQPAVGEEASQIVRPDLAHLSLALIGGHEATRQGVIDELSTQYGLRRWVEVPSLVDSHINKRVLREKIEGCDLIVIITGYMTHSLTHSVYGLKAAGALRGEVVMLSFRGKSGIVREILKLVA